jgi:two-component system alkaline phosphatase synthesis response regulator PhoP
MTTILVVDDEPRIAQIARDYLERAGYAVVTAGDGTAALELARARQPALVVLDLKLPGVDGFEVARVLRRASDVPIVMLTARAEETDRLKGLDLGADDYVVKPFSPRELVARVRAVLRRAAAGVQPGAIVRAADLTIDVDRMSVARGTETIDLTSTEIHLLAALARQPGRVFTRARLLDVVRGTAVESFERAIDTHIKNIRRKLDPGGRGRPYIATVYGVGYKFCEP